MWMDIRHFYAIAINAFRDRWFNPPSDGEICVSFLLARIHSVFTGGKFDPKLM